MGKTTDVRAAVEKELKFDAMVDSRDITVRNISGDVTLAGTVPSYPQYVEAAAAARRVAGVTGVHNHLEVALPESDQRDDVKLATAANNALTQNVTVPVSVTSPLMFLTAMSRESTIGSKPSSFSTAAWMSLVLLTWLHPFR